MGDRAPAADPAPASDPVRRRALGLRLGLPRDPAASRHVAGFVVTAVVTVLVTRGLLAASGYPQVGGSSLHVAHVLWGGLLLGVAVVLLVSFAGPVVRPAASLVGGVGFGLFVDEIGKFVTADNDYFYQPAAALIYAVAVVLLLLGELLHGRRRLRPAELLAGATDLAVSGVAGGLSARARDRAHDLLHRAGEVPGSREVRALLDAIEDDTEELPDAIGAVSGWVVATTHRLVRARWVPGLTVAVLVLASAATVGRGLVAWAAGSDVPGWVVTGMVVSGAVSLGCAVVGAIISRGDAAGGFVWCRRAVLLSLLLTQIFLFRLDEWAAAAGLGVDLLLLGLIAAELDVTRSTDRRTSSARGSANQLDG